MRVVMMVLSVALSSCFGGYDITTCGGNHKVQIDETGDAVFTCTGITEGAGMAWRLNDTNGTGSPIASCAASGQCSVTDDYSVSRPQNNTSVLNVTGNYRTRIAGTVQCVGMDGGKVAEYASCDVTIVYTSYKVDNCTTAVNRTDWTVSGTCDVDKIYASDGHYSCQWKHRSQQGTPTSIPGQRSLTPFNDSTGQEYQIMTCSFTGQPLPTDNGTHTYSLTIDPRNTTDTVAYQGGISIQSPQGPPVLPNCPSDIVEGVHVSCTCQASASQPSALVSWTGDAAAVSTTSTLQLNNVSQSQNYTCRQYWGGFTTGHTNETYYAVNVKYTPYKVDNCTTAVNRTDWTVSGTCDVDKIYASDGNYSCQWKHWSPQGTLTPIPGQRSLTPFNDSTGQKYQSMTCSFTGQPLPTDNGTHTYRLTIDPRNTTDTVAYQGDISIHHGKWRSSTGKESPQGPPVLHNCTSATFEGDDVSCTCQASASEPSALVSWTGDAAAVSNTSTLQLNNVSQSQNYTCRQYWGGFSTGHTKETYYAVNFKYTPYKVDNCTTAVNRTDWTVSGTCDVDKIYAFDGNYSCQWKHWSPQGTLTPIPGQRLLTPSNDSTGQEYQSMTCSFTGQQLPTDNGTHTYRLTIDPRNTTDTVAYQGDISIQSPQGPPVLPNCTSAIVEGDDVNCTCQASASEPSALVSWYSSPVSNTPTLQLNNVSQSQNHTCRQYWGGFSTGHTKETYYTVNVKYPPSSPPEISGISNYTAGDNLNLTCTVRGGQPPVTSVTFHCDHNGNDTDVRSTHGNQTSVTSTVVISPLSDQDNGTVCLCSALWTVRPSVYSTTATVTIYVQGSDDNSDNYDNDNDNADDVDSSVAYIVGGVVGATLLIIIAIVILVVCIRKRRDKPDSGKVRSGDAEDRDDFVEHINSMYQSTDDFDLGQSQSSTGGLRTPSAENGTVSLPDSQTRDWEQDTDPCYSRIPPHHFGPCASAGRVDHQEADGSPSSSADQPGNDPNPHMALGPYASVDVMNDIFNQPVDGSHYSTAVTGSGNPRFVIAESAQSEDSNPYTMVNKTGVNKPPDLQNYGYTAVNKLRANLEQHAVPEDRGDQEMDSAQNVSDLVNESSEEENTGVPRPPKEEAEIHAQARKPGTTDEPLPAAKPKPTVAAKPSVSVNPQQAGVCPEEGHPKQRRPLMDTGYEDVLLNDQISITAEDDYNTLAFHRSPATELSENPESDYSHIGAVGQ